MQPKNATHATGAVDGLDDMESDDSGTDWESAIEQCEKIIDLCDELPERAEDFNFSVLEKTESIRDWIAEHETVTPAQQDALDNMESGVMRWLEC